MQFDPALFGMALDLHTNYIQNGHQHTVTLMALGYEGKLGRGLQNFRISSCFSTSCKIKGIFINTFGKSF
jgi:hypothetical protein